MHQNKGISEDFKVVPPIPVALEPLRAPWPGPGAHATLDSALCFSAVVQVRSCAIQPSLESAQAISLGSAQVVLVLQVYRTQESWRRGSPLLDYKGSSGLLVRQGRHLMQGWSYHREPPPEQCLGEPWEHYLILRKQQTAGCSSD